MTDVLLVDRTDGVATLTMNRPDSMNSLDVALKVALREAVESVAADPAVRAVVLAGAGRAFCVGQDLKEHVATLETGGPPLDTVTEHYNPLVKALATLPKPVIAAVRGMAAGAGASLTFLADFRIGGPRTAFLMAFANVGLAADSGASWTLPRLVGHAKAIELLMLAEPVPSAEAHRIGLLSRLVDDDEQVLPTAQELAARLAAGPTVAYGMIKRQLGVGIVRHARRRSRRRRHRAGAVRPDGRPPQRHRRLRGQGEARLHRQVTGLSPDADELCRGVDVMATDAVSRLVGRLRSIAPLRAVPFVVFLGWILTVAIIIHQTPSDGEGSPEALADALVTAIETKDTRAGQRLIADSPDTDAIASFLAELDCGSGYITAGAVVRDDGSFIQIAAAGGELCGRVPIAERDGRWFVDLWAAPIPRVD